MAGVLVFGDVIGGALAPASLEVATAGAALAAALGEPLLGALVGDNLKSAAEQFRGGFSSLYLVEGKHYRPYTAQASLAAAQAVIAACAPSVVLFCHTPETREWVPRLAARLDTGLATDCTVLSVEGKDLVVNKPVYGGGVVAMIGEQPKCPVMFNWAENDHAIPLDGVKKVEAAHPTAISHIYTGAQHGFNCDQRGSYNAESAKLARGRTIEFLRKHVG